MATAARMAICELRQARLSIPKECDDFEEDNGSTGSCVERVPQHNTGTIVSLLADPWLAQSIGQISSAVVFLFGAF
jgi:hypothetical protein